MFFCEYVTPQLHPKLLHLSICLLLHCDTILQVISSCNSITCLLNSIPSLNHHYQQSLHNIWSCSRSIQESQTYSYPEDPTLDPSDIANYCPVSLRYFLLSPFLKHAMYSQRYFSTNNLQEPKQSTKLSSVFMHLDISAAFDSQP